MPTETWLYESLRRLETKLDNLSEEVVELKVGREQLTWLVAELRTRKEQWFKTWQIALGFCGVLVSLAIGLVGLAIK